MNIKLSVGIGVFLLLICSVAAFPETDPKFWTGLTYSPANPKAGQTITFTAQFKVGKGDVTNLLVNGGVDNKTDYSTTYPLLKDGTFQTVTFTWIAQSGSHTAFIQLDPNQTSGDIHTTNNRVEVQFSVTGTVTTPKPNLVLANASYSPNPPSGKEPIVFKYLIQNKGTVESDPCEAHIKIDGKMVEANKIPALKAGGSVTLTNKIPIECGAKYEIIADGSNALSETNEGDNTWSQTINCISIITPDPVKVQKPNLVITNINYTPTQIKGLTNVKFSFAVENTGDAPSIPCNIAGSINTNIVFNSTVPLLQPGIKKTFTFTTPVNCNAKAAIVVDGGFAMDEQKEDDNTWEHVFGCTTVYQIQPTNPGGINQQPTIPPGYPIEKVKPNFILVNPEIIPYNFNLGDQVKLTFRAKNVGPGESQGPPVAIVKQDGLIIWQDKVGYKGYKVGEVSNQVTVPISTKCGPDLKIEVIIDPSNSIAEAVETDNQWVKKLGQPCTNLSVPWVASKKDANVKYPQFDERAAGVPTCGNLVYFRIYNKSKTSAPETNYSFFLNGTQIFKEKVNAISAGTDMLIHVYGFGKHGSYFWVKVDPDNKVTESDEADNTFIGQINCAF